MTLELTGLPGSTVDFIFGPDKKTELAALRVGGTVTVRGKCKGKVRAYVTFEDAILMVKEPERAVEAPPGPAIRVSADDLYKAFDENVIAAEVKYKNKVLEVTGKVNKVLRNDVSKAVVELQVEDGIAIVICEFLAKDTQQLAVVKKGQEVVIRGKCLGQVDDIVTLSLCSVVK
jgi:hypothetical protein